MLLVEDDHVVETLTANTPYEPFHVGILPRRPRCGESLLDAKSSDATVEVACRSSLLMGAGTAGSCAPATTKEARSTPARQCRRHVDCAA